MNFSVCAKYDTAKGIRTHPYEHLKRAIFVCQKPKNADTYFIFANKKPKPNTLVFDLGFDWRRIRDSNPCAREGKRFSRPPRYDRFDNSPYVKRKNR